MFPEIKTFPGQGLLRALWAAPRTLNAHKKGHRHYMPISVSFNTQQGIAPMQLHLGFSPFTFDTVPHQCKTVLILSVDHIISMWGTRGGSHSMLHEHRVEHGIQDAHISAVCFTTCIALAAILHRAIKQWSQPVQEQKGNQGRCPKWQVGKCTPDVNISVYEAFFFALLLIFMSSDQVHCWSLTHGTEPLEEKVLWIIVFFRNILCNVTATRRLSWGGVLNEWWHEKIHLQL